MLIWCVAHVIRTKLKPTCCKPKRANGTCWILHKLEAMKMFLEKLDLYIEHLEHLSSDKSIPSKDRQKMMGYLKKWKQGRMPLMLAIFIDLSEILFYHLLSKGKSRDCVGHVYYY